MVFKKDKQNYKYKDWDKYFQYYTNWIERVNLRTIILIIFCFTKLLYLWRKKLIYLFLILLLIIFYQDVKERLVSLAVLLITIALGAFLYFKSSFFYIYLFNILTNLLLLLAIIFVIYLYSKLKLKKPFFYSIALGDILFFIILAVSFPTIAFLILFSTSLLFSLMLFLILKSGLAKKTVPLAGFQSLFLFLILFINLIFNIVNIYAF